MSKKTTRKQNDESAEKSSPRPVVECLTAVGGRKPSAGKAMSIPEKDMLCIIQKEAEPLPYPLHALKMAYGPDAQEYEIPEEARQEVLTQLYPFSPCPKLTDVRLDIHEQKLFTVKDFRVIRERDRNFLVSPYYPQSGGMVIDWMPDDQNVVAQCIPNPTPELEKMLEDQ